jgi:hypothetical protein
MRLASAQMIERRVTVLVGLIDEMRVTLAERAAAGVLAAQTHVEAFVEQRREREVFSERPIDAVPIIDRFATRFDDALHGLVHVEIARDFGDAAAELAQLRKRRFGFAAAIVIGGQLKANRLC